MQKLPLFLREIATKIAQSRVRCFSVFVFFCNLNFGFFSTEIQKDFASDGGIFFEGNSQSAIFEEKIALDEMKAPEDQGEKSKTQVCKLSAEPIAVYLTWQRNPETTMTIQWITPSDEVIDFLKYRKEGEEQWSEAEGQSVLLPTDHQYRVHRIELVDLNPSSEYLFDLSEKIYRFKTMPAVLDQPIHFIIGGDLYPNSYECMRKTNLEAAKTDPFFALIGGDIAYTGSATGLKPEKIERWINWMKTWTETMITSEGFLIPVIPAVGNHDVNGILGVLPINAESFFCFFPMPGRSGYQVLDFSDYLSIFLLDTGHTHWIAGKQTEWLKEALEARQRIPNKFALYHIPAYPCVGSDYLPQSVLIRRNWCPLFERFGLHAAFEHHDHAYKRTHLIRDGEVVEKGGILYLGDGGWGERTPRKPKSRWYLAKTESRRHFILATLYPNGMKSYAAIDDQGERFDYVENYTETY